MLGGRYTRRVPSTSFLVRPRLGTLRFTPDMAAGRSTSRKQRSRKPFGSHKMDSLKKKPPDYTDIAYREAVARLRYLLAESYSPLPSPAKGRHVHHLPRGDDSGDDGESVALSERSRHHHHPLPANLYRLPTSYSIRRSLYPDSSVKPLRSQYLPSSSTTATALAPPASESEGAQKPTTETSLPPPELMTFIERQEEYIEQLEKESQFCREELAALLGKVKEVISENEGLHEREKAGLLKSVFDCFEPGEEEEEVHDDQEMDEEEGKVEKPKIQKPKKKRLEGPSIIFESRISELEAQLTQTKMDLRKALEEAEMYKQKVLEQQPGGQTLTTDCTAHGKLIEDLRREKSELSESVSKLQCAINQFREKEAEASIKVKRSLDIVDQAQFEKAQVDESDSAEMTQPPQEQTGDTELQEENKVNEGNVAEETEQDKVAEETEQDKVSEETEQDKVAEEAEQAELEVRRLKDELDRQHEKMREMLQEQGRKVQDERIALERRYTQQMDQLGTDLASQWDAASKLTMDLEKQRRIEAELRRELQQKTIAIEELKKELQNKIVSLQNELMQAATDKGSLEQELVACRLAVERAERDGRQEVSRLQAEVSALRQRLDRADADLMHVRRENLRLMDQVASLERELNLAKLVKEDSTSSPNKATSGKREKELTSMIMDMESKHAQTVAELEGMIQSQNQVMEKLKDECHMLTQRLEESSARHKQEMAGLQSNIDFLSNKVSASFEAREWKGDDAYARESAGPEHYDTQGYGDQQYIHQEQPEGQYDQYGQYGQPEGQDQPQQQEDQYGQSQQQSDLPEEQYGHSEDTAGQYGQPDDTKGQYGQSKSPVGQYQQQGDQFGESKGPPGQYQQGDQHRESEGSTGQYQQQSDQYGQSKSPTGEYQQQDDPSGQYQQASNPADQHQQSAAPQQGPNIGASSSKPSPQPQSSEA